MAKKKENAVLMWAILIAVVLLLSRLDWSTPLSSMESNQQFFVQKEKASTSLGNNLNDGVAMASITNVQKTDICNMLKPYILLLNLEGQCQTYGGMWTCTATEAGCYRLSGTSIDCSLTPIQSAISQCRSIGAIGYCDALNVYCKYP